MNDEELEQLLKTRVSSAAFSGGENETLKNARDARDFSREQLIWNEQRSASVADDFIRLEVQIATILFAFTGLFLNNFKSGVLPTLPVAELFTMRLVFSISVCLLIASLAFGLLYLKNCEQFWDASGRRRIVRANKWDEVVRGKATFEEGYAYEEGTKLDKGIVLSVPNWTWILQTICLSIAILLLFVLSIIFLFNQ